MATSAFEVHGVHQPVVAALRAVINWTPGFTDCPWQLVCDGRVDLFGPERPGGRAALRGRRAKRLGPARQAGTSGALCPFPNSRRVWRLMARKRQKDGGGRGIGEKFVPLVHSVLTSAAWPTSAHSTAASTSSCGRSCAFRACENNGDLYLSVRDVATKYRTGLRQVREAF